MWARPANFAVFDSLAVFGSRFLETASNICMANPPPKRCNGHGQKWGRNPFPLTYFNHNPYITTLLSRIDPDTSKTTKIYPLPHMYVVKDLVPDMTHFFEQYASVQPWLQREEKIDYGKEQIHQTVEDRKKLDGL